MSAPRGSASLQRRLLLYVLLAAPLVWSLAVALSAQRARHEVNELYDTELIRLALQVQATRTDALAPLAADGVAEDPAAAAAARSATAAKAATEGEADLHDMALAVWDAQGRLLAVDREGARLPPPAGGVGFRAVVIDGLPWRVYYLPLGDGGHVASAQRADERDELVRDLVLGQLLPWLAVLPVLLGVLALTVRQGLRPLRGLAQELAARDARSLQPVVGDEAPAEVQPLLAAMNGLLGRVAVALERERRFTADAAHELRTPLAVLRAQWDRLRTADDAAAREDAARHLGRGIDRMERLVGQMLLLARVEAADALPAPTPVDWAPLVEQAINDVLALAERRHIELAVEWPAGDRPAMPLAGDAGLLAVLLRNLLDNAVRYAPRGSLVTLSFESDALAVANAGPALSALQQAALGARFRRPEGGDEAGSGLGISIVQRVAALHGLRLHHQDGPGGEGVVMRVEREAVA